MPSRNGPRRASLLALMFAVTAAAAANAAPHADPEEIYRRGLAALPYLRPAEWAHRFASTDRAGTNDDGNRTYSSLYKMADGRNVIFDQYGPGVVTRMWFTGFPPGINIFFYFDEDEEPRLAMPLARLFSGEVAPFLKPLVGDERDSSGGFYSYVPLPFARRLRIATDLAPSYTQLDYHLLAPDARIASFVPGGPAGAVRAPDEAGGALRRKETLIRLAPGQSAGLELAGSGMIEEFSLAAPLPPPPAPPEAAEENGVVHKGSCVFSAKIAPEHGAVKLRRLFDRSMGDQRAEVLVDGRFAGLWTDEGKNSVHPWAESEFALPPALTRGRERIAVEIRPSSLTGWSACRYDVLCGAGEAAAPSDTVDVGDGADEAAHGWRVEQVIWRGRKTATRPPAGPARDFPLNQVELAWDFDDLPGAVRSPLGLFFAQPLGRGRVRSLPVEAVPGNGVVTYTSRLPMPFGRRAALSLTNRGDRPLELKAALAWRPASGIRRALERGEMGYLRTFHNRGATRTGEDYTVLRAAGAGHLAGVILLTSGLGATTERHYLEGDERIYVDGGMTPQIYGTGTEDFFNGGWYYKYGPFCLPQHGQPEQAADQVDHLVQYRFFLTDPVPFHRSLVFRLEHGDGNTVNGHYESLAFWYGRPAADLARTDRFSVADAREAAAHAYAAEAPEMRADTARGAYEGSRDGLFVTQTGVVMRGGRSTFTLAVDPRNRGVKLRRSCRQDLGPQEAEVLVDGRPAGVWYTPQVNRFKIWRTADFEIPAALARGKKRLNVSIVPRLGSLWTAYWYEAYAYVPPPAPEEERVVLADLAAEPGEDGIRLRWRVARGEPDCFRVYRSEDPVFPPAGTILAGEVFGPEFHDRRPPPGKHHYYRVAGLDAAGRSGPYLEGEAAGRPGLYFEAEEMGVFDHSDAPLKTRTGGTLSGGRALEFGADDEGHFLALSFAVPAAGVYRPVLSARKDEALGIYEVYLDGISLGRIDFYAPEQEPFSAVLGAARLEAGVHLLRFVAVGRNKKADDFGFYLDAARLEMIVE